MHKNHLLALSLSLCCYYVQAQQSQESNLFLTPLETEESQYVLYAHLRDPDKKRAIQWHWEEAIWVEDSPYLLSVAPFALDWPGAASFGSRKGKKDASHDPETQLWHGRRLSLRADDLPLKADKRTGNAAWISHYYDEVYQSYRVNPYGQLWKSFNETVDVVLYDSLKALGWKSPVNDPKVTSDFGLRRYRWHYGVDLRLKRGDHVKSAFYGKVRIARYQRRGFGHYVVVHHYNGLETIYAHLSKRLVKRGDIVRAGDVVGLGGNTGRSTSPHLHFEVRYRGMPINPNDMLDFVNNAIRSRVFMLKKAHFAYLKHATSIRTHRVKRGQTLSHISAYYGVSIRRLCRLNHISSRAIIRIGQRIRVK